LLLNNVNKKTVFGLSGFQFMAMARRGLFYTFLSLYLRDVLGMSVTATTLLASISMIANSVSQTLIWGKICDKYQASKSLLVIGETTAMFGYILVYFFHVYLLNTTSMIIAGYGIIAGLSILEFFWSMSNVGWSALISDVTTSKERGKLMGVISCVGGVGQIFGISVSGLMYDWGGEAGGFKNGSLFFFAAGIMLASVVLIWFSIKPSKPTFKGEMNVTVSGQNMPVPTSSRMFYWFLLSIFVVGFGFNSIMQILLYYVALKPPIGPIGATSLDITMIRNSASIAMIIVSLLAGFIVAKIGNKRAIGMGFVLAAITPIFYTFAQNVAQMIVINALSGVSMAFMNVVGYVVASDLIPATHRGRLFGQYNAVTYISFGIAGTCLGGPIADYLISTGLTKAAAYITTFQVASAVTLIGVIVYALKFK
jgi:MFS family permease